MPELLKVALLGITGVLIAVSLKSQKPEYAVYIGLTIGILIFGSVLKEFGVLKSRFEEIERYLGSADKYMTLLLKVIGVTYICEFSSGICKDAGYVLVAQQIEVLGKLSVLFAGMPVLLAVIDQMMSFT